MDFKYQLYSLKKVFKNHIFLSLRDIILLTCTIKLTDDDFIDKRAAGIQ